MVIALIDQDQYYIYLLILNKFKKRIISNKNIL